MADTEDWRTHWTTYEDGGTDHGIVHDVCNGIRMIAETGANDPVETIALSIAGAEAAEALTEALASEWALYTPEQITATASAVFSQLEGVLANLQALKDTLDRMEARRETAFTAIAHDRLKHAAAAVEFARGFAPGVIDALHSLPRMVELPRDAHELLAAVADLLGPDAELRTVHDPGTYREDDRTPGSSSRESRSFCCRSTRAGFLWQPPTWTTESRRALSCTPRATTRTTR
ncbi:hypothetical protein [Streptomyces vinaceus]|uniref:hypothetical protein n=1 Tax=Streptomyces vinaceus TaxID=1960 RepID=UPI0035D703F5